MKLCAVRIRERLNKLIQVNLLFTDVMTELCGDVSVITFGVSVCLRMVRGCHLTSEHEDLAYGIPEFCHELGTIVLQNGIHYPKWNNPMIRHDGRDIRHVSLQYWDSACRLAVTVGDDVDKCFLDPCFRMGAK